MAVISGFLAETSIHGYDRLYLTGDLDDYTAAWIDDLVYWAALPSPGIEALTENYPVSTTPYARSGWIGTSYYDDFYNRVHLSPRTLDIGNLLSVQTRNVSVWNAWITSQALSNIVEIATDGLTESGIVAPTTFTPLQERDFIVTVNVAGPATIDASYVFSFPSENPILSVIGRRVVVFAFPPNWAEPVVESLEWLTDVMLTHGGIEQRAGLRGTPRRALEYALTTLDRQQTNVLETVLLGWQSRLFAVPVWTDVQTLEVDVTMDSTVIACNTDGFEFTENGLALLWDGANAYESVEVAAPVAGFLLLKAGTLHTWKAGTRLYPIRLGRLQARQSLDRHTAHHVGGKVQFSLDDHPGVVADDTGPVYEGYRVYAGRNNWREPVETEMVRQIEDLDYQTGKFWRDDLSGLAAILKSWQWTLGSRAEIVAFRAWLHARGGRLNPFWSISQAIDMEVVAAVGAADTAITVRNIGYHRFIAGRVDRRHIAIRTVAGTTYYRRITASSEVDAASETLAIDSAIGVLLQPADIASVRFMHLTRLEGDAVEIEWHTPAVAESRAMLRSLPA